MTEFRYPISNGSPRSGNLLALLKANPQHHVWKASAPTALPTTDKAGSRDKVTRELKSKPRGIIEPEGIPEKPDLVLPADYQKI